VNPDRGQRRIHLIRACYYGFFHQTPVACQKALMSANGLPHYRTFI
jgi:hypothetical protein